MPSMFGRAIIDVVTNKSGGSLAKGDVVIVDTANDHAVTTTTSGSSTATIGVVAEENGIANNATGRVQFGGYVGLVTVNASVTRGHYGITHTVAKQAADGGASRVVGAFCQFLTGGTTPTAWLFVQPDASSASGNVATDAIWDTKGDLAVGTGANTASKLAAGANGTHLVAASGEATGLKWEGVGWTDYTPTVTATTTNPTQGSSVIAGRYKMLDAKTMLININWTITTGGAWNAGSGAYSFSLPGGFTASATMEQQLTGKFLDSGTDNKVATGTVAAGSTLVNEVVIEGVNTFSNSSPVTLATGDKCNLTGILEIQ